MADIKLKIKLTEKEVMDIIAKEYGLKPETSTIHIYQYKAGSDPREHDYTEITVEGAQIKG